MSRCWCSADGGSSQAEDGNPEQVQGDHYDDRSSEVHHPVDRVYAQFIDQQPGALSLPLIGYREQSISLKRSC